MCESLSQPFDCWQCPDLDVCEKFEAKRIILYIIPYEIRPLGNKIDKLLEAKKIEKYIDRINYLLYLRKIENRLDHLLQLKKVDSNLDKMLLHTSKDYVEKLHNIMIKIKKEFKKIRK